MLGFLRGATHRLTGAARWVVTIAVGLLLIAVGVVMLFTPGPGWGAIILGLYLWAREFDWARRLLDRMVARLEEHRHRLPNFVGRLLDERNRRREIKRTAEQVATLDPPPDRPVDPPLDRTLDRTLDRSVDQTPDRTVERTVDRTVDRSLEPGERGAISRGGASGADA